MKPISALPTLFTLGNLVCGFASVAAATWNHPYHLETAACWIFAGMVFDALDGAAARLVKKTSAFGVELDSLADVVTFGLAPAALANAALRPADPGGVGFCVGALFLACAALRLARYNLAAGVPEAEVKSFRGLPTPAAAGMVSAYLLVSARLENIESSLAPLFFQVLPLVMLYLSVLMISNLRYVHLGSVLFKRHHTFREVVQIVFLAAFLSVLFPWSLFLLVLAYTLLGPLAAVKARVLRPAPSAAANTPRPFEENPGSGEQSGEEGDGEEDLF